MIYKITYFTIIFYFGLIVNVFTQEKSKDNISFKYNGIYQTGKDGKEFILKNDSTQTYKIDTIGFVSINKFKKSKISFDYNGYPTLLIELDDSGKEEFSILTGNNIGKPLAFIINDILYTAPVVNGKIHNGQFEISGFDSVEELEKLKRLIEVIKLRTAKGKLD